MVCKADSIYESRSRSSHEMRMGAEKQNMRQHGAKAAGTGVGRDIVQGLLLSGNPPPAS
jgi:hypothetical protein